MRSSMEARTPCLHRCSTKSTASPSQQGVEGTDSEEVWMLTEESAILVMSTSLLGKICILPSKEAHFMPARYKLHLVAQFVGPRGFTSCSVHVSGISHSKKEK